MNISPAGVDLIKSFENCRLVAYPDQGGVYTCGWGATGSGVVAGTVWTQEQADNRLQSDLSYFEDCVNDCVRVMLTQGQFDALTDFAYNEGCGALKGSTLLRLLNDGQIDQAAEQFLRWQYADGKLDPGLERRRLAEQAMFNSGGDNA